MMIQLNWENMNQAEADFVNDIVCASIFYIVRTSKVESSSMTVYSGQNTIFNLWHRMQIPSYRIVAMNYAL